MHLFQKMDITQSQSIKLLYVLSLEKDMIRVPQT